MLKNEIELRNIPEVLTCFNGNKVKNLHDWELRKTELKKYFESEIYGKIPEKPISINFEEIENDSNFCAGKANLKKIKINCKLKEGNFSFPIYCTIPKKRAKLTFVLINFRPNVPDRYLPSEELIDNDCAVFSFCYKDVTSDDGDFKNGLAGILFENGFRQSDGSGKIAMWAWGAMRVMDYIETLNCIDKTKVVVIGHSRLGKTALLTSAFDERFMSVASNDSGCCGAAITRKKEGETLKDIYSVFSHWFCPNFKEYAINNTELQVDQHCLLALSAPRKVYIASAEKDIWSDPKSEYLACVSSSKVYNLYGLKGFIHPDNYLTPTSYLHAGEVAYHIRTGTHYFSRADWLLYLKYYL